MDSDGRVTKKARVEETESSTDAENTAAVTDVVTTDAQSEMMDDMVKFAVVCSSNMNRSMEAHNQLRMKGLNVKSYGVGSKVRLPGPQGQLAFDFGTPYREIKAQIDSFNNPTFFNSLNLIGMLERNIKIKDHPERFQEYRNPGDFDVIVCFEERVFDLLMEDMNSREAGEGMKAVHVINLDVEDNSEESIKGAQVILDLCEKCNSAEDLDDTIAEIIEEVEEKHGRTLLHMTLYV